MKRLKQKLNRKVNAKNKNAVFGMIRRIVFPFFCVVISSSLYAQVKTIRGTVLDAKGETIIGAAVVVAGTQRGTTTDMNGVFSLSASPQESIKISYIGYKTQIVQVGNQTEFSVALQEDQELLDEVVVVAFGTQKKESLISAIETINPKELKVPSSNLTTALAGRLSGVIAYQRSGEPGKDNADFFIRGVTTFGYKKDPLILIDGIETTSTELARLTPDDIEAFSILKDATATALYGARGANGVIQVKTKEGREGPVRASVRIENSFSQNTNNVKLADPVTYMILANEAANTRLINESKSLFSPEKIDQTRKGANPYVYPANDWRKLLMNDFTDNQRANMSLSGGGGVARYYVAASYAKDNGNLKVDKQNNFNNNIDLRSYQLRSNINLDITKTTEAIVRLAGSFDDYSGPLDGGETMYKKVIQTSPVAFPAYYPASYQPKTNHVLFGNAQRLAMLAGYMNPYADMTKGYKESTKSLIDAAFELKQDFDFITKGLKARALFNTSRYSFFDVSRQYIPYYYEVRNYDRFTDTIDGLKTLAAGEEYLNYAQGGKDINSTIYVEAAVSYNSVFNNVHDISGLLVYNHREQLYSNKETLQLSLPYRNQGISGRFTYAYDSRYMIELNFGYNGSERFHKKERFGFFPAAGAGWIVSNEKFWRNLEKTIPKFKLKGTYGLVGNDAIGDENDRFFYLSEMNMHDGGRGYTFGDRFSYGKDGVRIVRYENPDITWETAYKTNLGIELNVGGYLELQADYFTETRKNILMARESLPSTLGLSTHNPKANIGAAKSNGFECSLDYNNYFSSGYWLQSRANFTYAHSEFLTYEEPAYKEAYKSRIGNPINQQYGLIAERLFVDEYEVANSPIQTYGEYMAGDLKYRDVNGDGIITDLDVVPLGYPDVPEIVYGFGASFGNSHFDVSIFFQGQARSSFWLDVEKISPFRVLGRTDEEPYIKDIPILEAFAKSHWSENDRNLYALWPRLSDNLVSNNTQRSSWFMRNGAFLRLKTIELGYKLPEKLIKRAHLNNARVYVSGNNLFVWSGFKLWDIEMGGNGLGYPIQRVYNIGLQIGF